ncbi:MAG: hypothetical protein HYV28_05560 [Ignavibacteriales bacterium]|nr:hypothetical protein [Ignavibacteriales bacterium]
MYTLERISNVDSGFLMKQKPRKGAAFEKFLHQAYEANRGFPHDSAEFSPAAKFLQRIKWQLRSLKRAGEEKLQFHFMVDTVDFFTEIDEHHIVLPGKQHFRICDYFYLDNKQIQATLLAGVERVAALSVDEYEIQPLPAVKTFFDRSVADSRHHPLPFSAIPEFQWSDGIYRNIESELLNILVGVMGIAEKVLQMPVPKKTVLTGEEPVVQLEKLMINEYTK